MTVQALTGIMSRLGEPGQPPIYLGMGSGDAMGGLMAALGILLALYARERTGRGQFLDASLYGAQLFMAAPTLQAFLATQSEAYSRQQSRKSPRNAMWNTYRARDKWLIVCARDEGDAWQRFTAALESSRIETDERFATTRARGALTPPHWSRRSTRRSRGAKPRNGWSAGGRAGSRAARSVISETSPRTRKRGRTTTSSRPIATR